MRLEGWIFDAIVYKWEECQTLMAISSFFFARFY